MADAFRVCPPFYFISLRIYYNILVFFCCIFGFIQAIVTFALSLVDALLFVHYAAVLLLEIRQMPPRYYLHVIRSPDGISRGYPIGAVSKFCLVFLILFRSFEFVFFFLAMIRYRSSGPPSGCWTSTTRNFRFTTRSWSGCRPGGAAQSWPTRPRSNSTTWTPRTITAPSIRYVHPPTEFHFNFFFLF